MAESTLIQEYDEQRMDAARRLFEIQKLNKGWGLRPGSESSLVNTTEALNVIAAAGLIDDERAHAGYGFLLKALRIHYRPESEDIEQPSRGLNVRYLTFALDGLLLIPDLAESEAGREAIRFCVEGIRQAQAKSGGVRDTPEHEILSYHQTGRALASTSKLIASQVSVPDDLLALAGDIADAAAGYLVEQQTDEAAWRATPALDSALSPAKTAIANTALAYYRLLPGRPGYADRQRAAADWLVVEQKRWFGKTSKDPQEAQTAWEHLDYAECVRGIAAGRPDAWTKLRSSWRLLLDLWSEREKLWAEPPSADEGNVTIRAAYHTVMAFESVLDHSLLLVPPPLAPVPFGKVDSITYVGDARFSVKSGKDVISLDLGRGASQVEMLRLLIEAPEGLTADKLAERLEVGVPSINVYAGRLRASGRAASAGRIDELVRFDGERYRVT